MCKPETTSSVPQQLEVFQLVTVDGVGQCYDDVHNSTGRRGPDYICILQVRIMSHFTESGRCKAHCTKHKTTRTYWMVS